MGLSLSSGTAVPNSREAAATLFDRHAQLLRRLSGAAAVPFDDPFWADLLAFPDVLSRLDPDEVERVLQPTCAALATNNGASGHFQLLLLHAAQLLGRRDQAKAATNALHLCQVVLKFAAEHLTVERMLHLVAGPKSAAGPPEGCVARILDAVVDMLAEGGRIPPTGDAYVLHVEALYFLLAAFGTQATQALPHAPSTHPWVAAALRMDTSRAASLVTALLRSVCQRPPPPRGALLYRAPQSRAGLLRAATGSLLRPVALVASAIMGRPQRAGSPPVGLPSPPPPPPLPPSPLADAGLLVLLLLLHVPPSLHSAAPNPFGAAFADCHDAGEPEAPPSGGESGDPEAGTAGQHGAAPVPPASAAVAHAELYRALCSGLAAHSDAHMLLLYTSLHGSPPLSDGVLERTDPEKLLVPLLSCLSHGGSRDAQYVALVVLLQLSQEPAWHNALHAAPAPSPLPPSLRSLAQRGQSAGSLLVLVLCRCVARSLAQPGGGDVYLHTSSLAVLANAAPHAAGLAPQPASRLWSLLCALARRSDREAAAGEGQQAALFGDLARLLLEALNCMLTYAAPRNPELVYALLQRQEALQPLGQHPALGELVHNALAVADWFAPRVEDARLAAQAQARAWSAGEALECVRVHAAAWRADGLRVFEPLRFTYEQEEDPEEFFVPHAWALVVAARLPCAWHAPSVMLLPADEVNE